MRASSLLDLTVHPTRATGANVVPSAAQRTLYLFVRRLADGESAVASVLLQLPVSLRMDLLPPCKHKGDLTARTAQPGRAAIPAQHRCWLAATGSFPGGRLVGRRVLTG